MNENFLEKMNFYKIRKKRNDDAEKKILGDAKIKVLFGFFESIFIALRLNLVIYKFLILIFEVLI